MLWTSVPMMAFCSTTSLILGSKQPLNSPTTSLTRMYSLLSFIIFLFSMSVLVGSRVVCGRV